MDIMAYPLWGLFFQLTILWIVMFLISAIVVLPLVIEANASWVVGFLKRSWPGWLYTVTLIILQQVLSRFVFAIDNSTKAERGKYDTADPQGYVLIHNRRLYDIVSFIFWFNNIFIGLFSLLLRVIWSLIIGLIFIGRMDHPAVQRNFELRDTGYSVYLGFQGLEEGNTHPVMIVAIQMFLSGLAGKRYRARIAAEEEHVEGDEKPSDERAMDSASFRAKWRWQLAYFLVMNPSLVHGRKKVLWAKAKEEEALREAEKKLEEEPEVTKKRFILF